MTVPQHGARYTGAAPTPAAGEPADGTGDALVALRAAVGALPEAGRAAGSDDEPDPGFDAAEHAARFEAVHHALVAVLADLDRT